MALSASWMATCVIAYRRASAGPGPSGEMHAATAASPALAFHAVTASVAGNIAWAGVADARSAQAAQSKALNGIWTLLLVDRPMRSIRSTIGRGGCVPLNAG